MQAHMYVRVKRQKLTVFLSVAPTDTIEAMQLALQEQINELPENMRLYKDGTLLAGHKTAAECGIETDDMLGLSLKQPDGGWEPVTITPYDQGEAAPDAGPHVVDS